ncbi:thioredoxin family protein [Telluribacter sp. SYSU D00476]|uniref:thioredoxin family protein n=1 Tax=Telluribacter sp. SYSU D00476 TaxID=2811430 RepID=UPI001FF1AB6C|nr:thioredoxin family protein [Telluribacter sp. SYSU D00476]
MIRTLYLLLLSVCLVCIGIPASAQIRFERGSWENVKAKAKAEKKLIFVDVYAIWCGPCKVLNRQVFSTKEVGEKMNSFFISYKADAEAGGRPLALQYSVKAYPTGLFLDHEGKVVHQFVGFRPVHEFLAEADRAFRTTENGLVYSLYKEAFDQGRRDAELLLIYFKFRRIYNLPTHEQLEQVLADTPADSLQVPNWQKLIAQNTEWARGKGFEWLLTQKQTPNIKNRLEFIISNSIRVAQEKKDLEAFQRTLAYLDEIEEPRAARELKTRYEIGFYTETKKLDKLTQSAERYLQEEVTPYLTEETQQHNPEAYKKAQDRLSSLCWTYINHINKDKLSRICDCMAGLIQKEQNPHILNQYASLLYKQGNRQEAIEAQTQALTLAQDLNLEEAKDFESTLKQMKRNKL